MKNHTTKGFKFLSVAALICGFAVVVSAQTAVPTPKVTGPLPVGENNFPMLAASRVQEKVDLQAAGYVEEEFMVFMLDARAHPEPGTLVKYAPEFAGMPPRCE